MAIISHMFIYLICLSCILGIMSKSERFLNLIVIFGVGLAGICMLVSLQSAISPYSNVPNLRGSDGEGYFIQAQALANNDDEVISHYLGYQKYLAHWFIWFGDHIAVALAANATFLLLTNYFLFRASQELGLSKKGACISVIFFMLTTEFVSYTVLLLREPAIALAQTLFMFGVASLANAKKNNLFGISALVTACFLLAAFRTTQLFFIMIALVVVFPSIMVRGRIILLIGFLLLMSSFSLIQSFSTYNIDAHFVIQTVMQNEVIINRLDQGDINRGGIVGSLADFLDGQPFMLKVALFPLTASVQFILPFDIWSFKFFNDHISYFFDRNLKIVWLLILGPLFLYAVRKYSLIPNSLIRQFVIGGIISYLLVAIIYGGAISRYAAPMLVFAYPAMAYFFERSLSEVSVRRSLKRHFKSYYLLLMVFIIFYTILILFR